MSRRLRAALLICLAPLTVWAISLVPSGSAAFGYSGGPPPPTTCPPDATTNPAGHCPPGSNGGGHGHVKGASTAAGGADLGAGSGQVATGSAAGAPAVHVEAVSQSRGTTNQAGAALKDQLAHGSTVPVTRTDVIELVILALVAAAALALIGRFWLRRHRLA